MTSSKSSRRRRRRRDYSGSDSASDSTLESDRNQRRSRSRNRSSSRRLDSDDSESDTHERSRKNSKRKITEEEISEYLAKKAQKKAMKVAKKLKSQTVSGYSNDSNPFGDSNLNERLPKAAVAFSVSMNPLDGRYLLSRTEQSECSLAAILDGGVIPGLATLRWSCWPSPFGSTSIQTKQMAPDPLSLS
ncbi:unnamed protein product [Fraxinus pennsylvanica]|uniref:Uncharacterized protein n=1 Tax=Fraxinus pennsylvanica TaxID=56036 RepID=A0AAD1ZS86_9LAMI|nr:unnamed protein product [Fraxinus pennsylvanica]